MIFNRLACFIFCFALSSLAHAEETKLFKVETTLSRRKVKIGEATNLSVKIIALAPAKINKEAPMALELKPNVNLTYPKFKFAKSDAKKSDDREIQWEISLKALKAGNHQIEGHLSFYLCTDKWCRKFETDFSEKIESN